MAGRGPTPKKNAVRRNKHPEVELTGNAVEAPKLFKRAKYSTATQRWWDTWVESPQAESFMPTDWERLQQIAPLVEAYWKLTEENPKAAKDLLAEIRLNEERLGATVADRQRLRMHLKRDTEEPQEQELPEEVIAIDKYRSAFG